MTERACAECKVCCTVKAVPDVEKPGYTPCKFVCATGCSIYETRPPVCAGYSCLWLVDDEGKILRDEERPDKNGLLFEMSGVHSAKSRFEQETGIAFLTVRESTPGAFDTYRAKKTLQRLSKKTLILMAYEGERRVAIGPPEKLRVFGAFLARVGSI